jgi:alcohol dehydrogenase
VDIEPNPTFDAILRQAPDVVASAPDVIVAVGGGSTLDAAKAFAALRGVGDPEAWLRRHVRDGQPYPADFKPTPLIAVPTTAGTGSEVTMWATLWAPATCRKYSVSHPALYPEHAVMVPALTHSMDYTVSLFSALDALSHAMEAIWNRNANPVSDALAAEAIGTIHRVLTSSYASRFAEPATRFAMQQASLVAGLAFSNTRTAIAHSVSYPLTAGFNVPHGLACSFTLGEILRLNGEADPDRVGLIARALGCRDIEAAAGAVYRTYEQVGVGAQLKRFIRARSDVAALDADFITPGRADNNLVPVTQGRARALVDSALSALGM